ncbi:MAG: hypothetical protein JW769_01345 [Parachlamydiales bacterium]|nr:hypothetical protein [Parachlamydiales bacterium]
MSSIIRIMIVMICSFIVFGCNDRGQEISRFYDDGRAKPVVHVTSIIDSTNSDTPWSLSEEFTYAITQKISTSGNLFIPKEPQSPLSLNDNPFGTDISWVQHMYSPSQFIVFIELFEHEEVPIVDKELPAYENYASHLNMGARIRIVDTRNSSPQIILQEIYRDSYYIAKNILKIDYNVAIWGTNEYKSSPMAMAHDQFTKNIAERIDDYILLAKNR